MSSISAQVVTGQVVRVTLDLDNPSGTMRIWCINPDGSRRPVIGTLGAARSGSWDDPEAPIGKPVTYVAAISSGASMESLGPDLVANGGAEDLMAGWDDADGGWYAADVDRHSGARCFTHDPATGPMSQPVAVEPGLYRLSAWCAAPVDVPVSIGVTTVGGDVADVTLTAAADWGQWVQTTADVTIPDGASTAVLSVGSSGDWCRVDDIELRMVDISTAPTIGPSDPVMIPADHPLMSDPWRGIVCPVTVLADGQDGTMAGRDTAVDVIGRRSRIHVWDVEAAPTFSPQFITEPADHAAFEDLMATGDPLLLRFPCMQHPDVWLQRGGDRTWSWLTRRCQARKHTLSSCEELEGPPSDEAVWTDTLGDVHQVVGGDSVGTLGAIAERWETLGEIAATDLKALT